MLQLLKDWVRDLVIIVIFANLLEMLLPDSAMRKYLKVVMGFFILLTVLNPLLTLLQADYQAFYPFDNLPGQKQQQAIQNQGHALRKQNQEAAMATFQKQLAQQIRGLILTQTEIDDAQVKVQADVNGKLQQVSVKLQIRDVNQEVAASSSRIERIDPVGEIDQVDQVKIEISPQSPSETPQRGSDSTGEEDQVDPRIRQVEKKVINLLTSFYNLKPEAIQFQ